MEQTFGTFYMAKYLAVCLAILLWLHHVYIRQTLSSYEKTKALKQWNNLPILLSTQSNEETLDSMINAECDKLSTSHSLSIIVSLIAAAIFLIPL